MSVSAVCFQLVCGALCGFLISIITLGVDSDFLVIVIRALIALLVIIGVGRLILLRYFFLVCQ